MFVPPSRPTAGLGRVLLGAYLPALVYGSLYPWSGWRATGLAGLGFLLEPWPRYWTWFDILANVGAYWPLGAALTAVLQRRWRGRAGILLAVLLASLTSLTLESLQSFLPGRVPSRTDWLANTGGALLGALSVGAMHTAGGWYGHRWQRHGSTLTDSAPGLALLTIWLAIQLPPQRLPFSVGALLEPGLRGLAAISGALLDTDETGVSLPTGMLATLAGSVRASPDYSAYIEAFGGAAAIVAIGMVVREIWPSRAPRFAITTAVLALAIGLRCASSVWLLGPQHALAWLSAGAQGGIVTGAIALALLSAGRRRARLRIAMLAVLLAAGLASVFPPDAYFDSMMQRWDRGAWRNIHGLLQALAIVWPLAAIAWCLSRLQALRKGDHSLTRPPG